MPFPVWALLDIQTRLGYQPMDNFRVSLNSSILLTHARMRSCIEFIIDDNGLNALKVLENGRLRTKKPHTITRHSLCTST